ncbi:hypothetical protein DBR12_03360 [Acidovorax sp. HMWF029]|uniref:ImmA/IrrE family metallo-endopeptidase n=1 Tax=Acidovorax sp. HMWF029 TaxID=2056863 RepID=UPI000D387DCD|nr:ImmA/IrrE family metallo-endopeptidase [Acidovorax sp. HMWF029]PTT22688.1 hypothetical protein DBR12_03360 [Acidovorax sp. HMWF029]
MTRKSKAEICESVQQLKSVCAEWGFMDADGSLVLKLVYEHLQIIWPGWLMLVRERDEMGAHLGITNPFKKTIALRDDVYRGMCAGDPEHCFTAAHELGHMVMHSEVTFARMEKRSGIEMVEFEGEADSFAVELLGFDSPANQKVLRQLEHLLESIKLQPDEKKGSRND